MAGAGIATVTRRSGHGLLGIYLNDHLAGATGGLELHAGWRRRNRARRMPVFCSVCRLDRAGSGRAAGHHGRTWRAGPRLQGLRRVDWREGGPAELNGYLLARSPLTA